VVAERDLPYEVPELRYVEVETRRLAEMRVNSSNWWGVQIPIALCVRCERRYTEDPNKDAYGLAMNEDPEDDLEIVCDDCRKAAFGDALREDVVEILDETLGLGEVDRKAIRAFIETIFTDPQKILQVQDLHNRVRELEKQTNNLWMAFMGAILALLIALAALVVSVVS
jgi:hypothetical protein